jgi:diacylglycerol O-acyltransferase / wax synthase
VHDRLTSADVAFFYLEAPSTPQHVGGLAVFDVPGGFDYDRLVRLLEERISLVPRYRQRLRSVPANLANPVWVDDANFDITYHVRRSALPRPGTDEALLEFCGRIQSRVLDRRRPLWEMYLVEALAGDRIAIVTKTHPSMVDGDAGIDITQVLLDESPQPRRTVAPQWTPRREPSPRRLVTDALCDATRRPAQLADALRLSVRDARSTANWVGTTAAGVVSALTGSRTRPPGSPLSATLSRERRIAIARTRLDDYRRIRAARGGTVNDVVLSVVAGALRMWLGNRGEQLSPSDTVRALTPVGMTGVPESGRAVSRVHGLLVDLPVGEPDPLRRHEQVQHAMATHAVTGPVGADALVALSGFAPPTMLSLSARAAHGLTRRMYAVGVTNVPGPQQPRYAAGARMREMFPILPLSQGHALSIAVSSYDGGVYFGVTGDRDAVPDLAEFTPLLVAALAELGSASQPKAPRRTRRERTP